MLLTAVESSVCVSASTPGAQVRPASASSASAASRRTPSRVAGSRWRNGAMAASRLVS
uniref:Uncharacterized protein n=1 Tax=Human herpesvirus 2 TaxID=10310 RepID=A0A481TMS1_HHV2|nr:hypothetical protein [Human alphaherpesvirus 2]QBH78493.1 hypothetical protein [Human alphaherpesvirus 2]QBH78776.1 hypothetical protein [Human alphaherpesvirus 2]QBH79289.1 hypothetical protein [Human alphaherpesvirus 2]QBH80106.1 hypothetical protein [Human alphaherpesvirus 2]